MISSFLFLSKILPRIPQIPIYMSFLRGRFEKPSQSTSRSCELVFLLHPHRRKKLLTGTGGFMPNERLVGWGLLSTWFQLGPYKGHQCCSYARSSGYDNGKAKTHQPLPERTSGYDNSSCSLIFYAISAAAYWALLVWLLLSVIMMRGWWLIHYG
ncbi:hypothetical protein Ancab_026339 [Ancistrocladus abbreviatus]